MYLMCGLMCAQRRGRSTGRQLGGGDAQGNHQRALDIWLAIEDPCVFAYIKTFHLYEAAAHGVAPLMAIDEDRTVALLVSHHDAVPAAAAVAHLQAAAERAAAPEEARTWRRRLYSYMHALFLKERRASHNSHDLQVRPLRLRAAPCAALLRAATVLPPAAASACALGCRNSFRPVLPRRF